MSATLTAPVDCSCGVKGCPELGWPHEWNPIAAGDTCVLGSDGHPVAAPYVRTGSGYACGECYEVEHRAPAKPLPAPADKSSEPPDLKVGLRKTNPDGTPIYVGDASDGYKAARFIAHTPFSTMREWRQAMIDAIPEAERCENCNGSGADVILASNGGVGEVVSCWPCNGTGRKGARWE